MLEKLLPLGELCVGNRTFFTKQQRFYNLANIMGVVFYLSVVIINFINQLFFQLSLLCLVLALLHGLYFYLGRYKRIFKWMPWLLVIQSILIAIITWFSNAGANGPMPMLFVFAQAFLFSFVERRWQIWVTFFLVAAFISLTLIEYFAPEVVVQYPSVETQLIDLCCTYLVVVFVFLILTYVSQNDFDLEHNKLLLSNKLVIEQNEKLERLNNMRTRLLAVLSHDIRSPLTNIYSLIDACHEDLIDITEFNSYTRELQLQISYNLGLLDSLVFWARAQSDNFLVQKVEVALNEMVLQSASAFDAALKHKQLDLIVDIKPQVKIICDPDIVKIVVRNVLSNAIKFSHANNKILISTQIDAGNISLIVTDYGLGMDKATLDSLFKPELTSKLGTQNEKGAGLGLTMCRDFMTQLGGAFNISSAVNKGTTVFIKFKQGS
ncbi:MAG: HAMP domain-containing histidine kinase [Bacteroidia bacterium]|nr:HAMP domain-containing histidine kinase [Bacteroidia bacterium]